MGNDLEKFEKDIESLKCIDKHGNEFWKASELMHFLGYNSWNLFSFVMNSAMIHCMKNGYLIDDYFMPVFSYDMIFNVIVSKELIDYKLARTSVFLIIMCSSSNNRNVLLGKEYVQYKRMTFNN